MNVELLREVQKAILEEPRRIDMGKWAIEDDTVPCGTVACVYGWARALKENLRGKELVTVVEDQYDNPLQLSFEEAGRLYYATSWPYDLRRKLFSLLPQTREYAQVVSDRIDRFIPTNGQE